MYTSQLNTTMPQMSVIGKVNILGSIFLPWTNCLTKHSPLLPTTKQISGSPSQLETSSSLRTAESRVFSQKCLR